MQEHLVDEAVILRPVGGEPAIAVGVGLDLLERLARVMRDEFGAKNPKSRYIEVFAGHLTTPLAARGQVVEWINSL